jgi:CO/xanthine dehydrogenase FAD-binding subunit
LGRDSSGRAAVIETSYFEPADVREARALLARHPKAAVLDGGTDLIVGARSGKRPLPESILAIHRLSELRGIESSAAGGLKIGALTTHGDLEASVEVVRSWSALADAAALVGSPATRHLGTVGGNLCNASPAMELGSPLLVFDAWVELAAEGRKRRVPLGEFVLGPGRTSAATGELLTAVRLPRPPKRLPTGSAYQRLEYRRAMEIAVVGAAALIAVDRRGRIQLARIALTAVAPTCIRASAAEELMLGKRADDQLVEEASRAAADAARPIDDVRASAAYRREMVAVIASRTITKAIARARGALA